VSRVLEVPRVLQVTAESVLGAGADLFEANKQEQLDDNSGETCEAIRRDLRYNRPLGRSAITKVHATREKAVVSHRRESQAL
jgi:hypothetical protein